MSHGRGTRAATRPRSASGVAGRRPQLLGVSQAWVEPVRSLLEAPSPAVLTTYRKDGSAHTVPVWHRWTGEAFEAVRPFRGVEVVEGDVASARVAIAGRYLGVEDG